MPSLTRACVLAWGPFGPATSPHQDPWTAGPLQGVSLPSGLLRGGGATVSGRFSPSEESTLLSPTGWPATEGLQFTSRMAPRPPGPQTQVFCEKTGTPVQAEPDESSASQRPLHLGAESRLPPGRTLHQSQLEGLREWTATSGKSAERRAEIPRRVASFQPRLRVTGGGL